MKGGAQLKFSPLTLMSIALRENMITWVALRENIDSPKLI